MAFAEVEIKFGSTRNIPVHNITSGRVNKSMVKYILDIKAHLQDTKEKEAFFTSRHVIMNSLEANKKSAESQFSYDSQKCCTTSFKFSSKLKQLVSYHVFTRAMTNKRVEKYIKIMMRPA